MSTTPPEPPEDTTPEASQGSTPEPRPTPPPVPTPIPPPPPLPASAAPAAPPSRYEPRALWTTVGVTLVVIALVSWLVPPLALVVPLILFVTLFFIRSDATPRRRSLVTGLLLGLGIGMILSAGICTAVFNGAVPSPLFNV